MAPTKHAPIRVLVVDDSALVRKLLTEILDSDPGIEVVGNAVDPYDAREKIKALSPHVLTLDVEMPKMDGLTFLRNLMRLHPLPVVMISSLTDRGADVTLTALELGAVDYLPKPKIGIAEGLQQYASEICDKVKAAAGARLQARPQQAEGDGKAAVSKPPRIEGRALRTTDRIIAIGASTGGTEAIAEILAVLPPDMPGIVIAQHIPEVFSQRFAMRLDRISALSVSEAKDGDLVALGHVFVAPGNKHLVVERSGAKYYCRLNDDPPVNRHRPSVDVLFRSVAQRVGPNAIGVILTGMGADGADGLRAIRDAGCPTIAQDRESSVVWGMPGEAVRRGGARETLPLRQIAARLVTIANAPVGSNLSDRP
jgi:two-component system chemotaxis response regulator CheB